MTLIPNSETRSAAQSLTLRGAAAMAVAFVLSRVGVDLTDGAAHTIVQSVTDLVFALGAMAVGVGRARAQTRLS